MVSIQANSQHRKDVELRKYIHKQLVSLKARQPLPSVREIMRDCGVSQSRVETVLDQLQDEGLLHRVPRRGIFKSEATESSRIIPMVDVVYCGVTKDVRQPEPGTHFHAELIDTLSKRLSQRHQGIRVHQFRIGSTSQDFATLFSKPDFQACIVVGLESLELITTASEHQVAWVSLFPQTVTPMERTILIRPDDVVRPQLEHLWQLGHERIGYMHIVDERVYHRDHVFRREAFYRLMAERGVRVNPGWVSYGAYAEGPFAAKFSQMLAMDDAPTAVIMADLHLPWAYRVARERGIAIGKQLSIVGTDDLPYASYLDPPATTVRVPRSEAANLAMTMLDRVIAGETVDSTEYLPVELVVRQSTGAAEEKLRS